MKIEEGPAFGALIIGAGVAFLTYKQTNLVPLALLIGFSVAFADYFFLLMVKRFKNKERK